MNFPQKAMLCLFVLTLYLLSHSVKLQAQCNPEPDVGTNNAQAIYIICDGDAFGWESNNDYVLPSPGCSDCIVELNYALYDEQPPAMPDPNTDTEFTGSYWFDQDYSDDNPTGLTYSSVGLDFFLDANNTIWFVPITMDRSNGDGPPSGSENHDANRDGCFDIGDPIRITFLNPIEETINSTGCNWDVSVMGGAVELNDYLGTGTEYTYNITDPNSTLVVMDATTTGVIESPDILMAGDYTVDITDDGNGCTYQFMVTLTADGSCPTVSSMASGSQSICDDDRPDLSFETVGIAAANTCGVNTDDANGDGIDWFFDATYTMPYDESNFVLTDACVAEQYTLYAAFRCDIAGDGFDPNADTYIDAGSINVTVYPMVTGTLSFPNDPARCAAVVSKDCAQFVATWMDEDGNSYGTADGSETALGGFAYDGTLTATPATSGLLTFVITNPDAPAGLMCHTLTLEGMYNCCPTVATPASGQQHLCTGDAPDLLLTTVGLAINADGPLNTDDADGDGVDWFLDPVFTQAYVDANSIPSTGCQENNYTLYAAVRCDANGGGSFDTSTGDRYVTAGAIMVTVYPEVTATANYPNNSSRCAVSISKDCPQFVATWVDEDGNNYGTADGTTTALGGFAYDGTLTTNTAGSGMITFTISNPNAPTGLGICSSQTLMADYACCPFAITPASGEQHYCDGGAADLSLNTVGLVINVNDQLNTDDADGDGVDWFLDAAFTQAYLGASSIPSTGCAPTNYTLYAGLRCDSDTDGQFNGNTDDGYVSAGAIEVFIYPNITATPFYPNAPLTSAISLTKDCPQFIATWMDTDGNDLSNFGGPNGSETALGGFAYDASLTPNPATVGTVFFMVINPDVPANLTACNQALFQEKYAACLAESGQISVDPICLEEGEEATTDIIVSIQDFRGDSDMLPVLSNYSTYLLIAAATTGNIEDVGLVASTANGMFVDNRDVNGQMALSYGKFQGYSEGIGADYRFYLLNYLTIDPPSLPTSLGGTIDNVNLYSNTSGSSPCFELSAGLTAYIPYPTASLTSGNSSEGQNGGVTPFSYNTHEFVVQGGNPSYQYDWIRNGFVRYKISTFEDGFIHPTHSTFNVPAGVPGAYIQIIYADQATWQLTVTDQNSCNTATWAFTNVPDEVDDTGRILDIETYAITLDNGTQTGAIDISVAGGCKNSDVNNPYQYNWVGPRGFSATTEDINQLQSGWYAVTVSDFGGISTNCADAMPPQQTTGWYWVPRGFSLPSGGFIRGKMIAETVVESQLRIHPNPATKEHAVFVQFNVMETNPVVINLIDITGKTVRQLFTGETQTGDWQQLSVPTHDLASGMYFIQLNAANGEQLVEKLVVIE